MSTRCIIGIKRSHQIDSIWCRSDGYPKGKDSVGEILNTHYCDETSVLSLIQGGNIDELHPDVKDVVRWKIGRRQPITTFEKIEPHIRGDAKWFYLFDAEYKLWLFSKIYYHKPDELVSFKGADRILDAYINNVVCGDPSTYQKGDKKICDRILISRLDNQQFLLVCDKCEAQKIVGDQEIVLLDSLAPDNCRA